MSIPLVNNAGVVWPLGPSLNAHPDEWAAAIAVNVARGPAGLTFALLPGMLGQDWGRVVNVSSGIAAHPPESMIGANAYAAGAKAALEAHTVNLAAELAGTGVTVNVFPPGPVDTAMQAWIRSQDPARIGPAALHDRFTRSYESGALITPEHSARSLLAHLNSDATGQIWGRIRPPLTPLRSGSRASGAANLTARTLISLISGSRASRSPRPARGQPGSGR